MNKLILLPFIFFLLGCNQQEKEYNCSGYSIQIGSTISQYDSCWSFKKKYSALLEKRKLTMVAEESRFLETKKEKEHDIALAELDSKEKEIRARTAATINRLIEDSVKDKSLLKQYNLATLNSDGYMSGSTPTVVDVKNHDFGTFFVQ